MKKRERVGDILCAYSSMRVCGPPKSWRRRLIPFFVFTPVGVLVLLALYPNRDGIGFWLASFAVIFVIEMFGFPLLFGPWKNDGRRV